MKFLVDAQLPISLSNFLIQKGLDSIHTLNLSDKNETSDNKIIEISLLESRIIITKDSDFIDSFLISGRPNKLVIVKTGNINNDQLILLFEKNLDKIKELLIENSLIEINKNEIVVHG